MQQHESTAAGALRQASALTGSFADAMQRAVAGDAAVATALLHEARRAATRELGRRAPRAPPTHDLDDVSQEAFARALQGACEGAVPVDAPAGAWMAGIARNVAREHRRRSRRRWLVHEPTMELDRRRLLDRTSLADDVRRTFSRERPLTMRGSALLDRVLAGHSLRSVAGAAGIPCTKLRRWLLRVASADPAATDPDTVHPSPRAALPESNRLSSDAARRAAALWQEGRSRTEIAAALGRSANAVKCLLRRLRLRSEKPSDPSGPRSRGLRRAGGPPPEGRPLGP